MNRHWLAFKKETVASPSAYRSLITAAAHTKYQCAVPCLEPLTLCILRIRSCVSDSSRSLKSLVDRQYRPVASIYRLIGSYRARRTARARSRQKRSIGASVGWNAKYTSQISSDCCCCCCMTLLECCFCMYLTFCFCVSFCYCVIGGRKGKVFCFLFFYSFFASQQQQQSFKW